MSSPVLRGPPVRHKAFRMERVARPGTGLFKGVGDAATNKQNELPATRRGVHFASVY